MVTLLVEEVPADEIAPMVTLLIEEVPADENLRRVHRLVSFSYRNLQVLTNCKIQPGHMIHTVQV